MEKSNPRRRPPLQTLSTLLGSLGLLACTATLTPDGTGSHASHAGGASAGTAGTAAQAATTPAIGQGVVRRISRTEYNNTVRDLLGTALTPADSFPGDIGEDGFDKASGPQSVVANHLTAFESGAATLIEAAFADPAQRARLVTCDLAAGTACVRAALESFLPRAWRRPVRASEVDRLMALAATEAAAGGSAEEQLKLVLRGAVTSAHFMYLVELDPDPASPAPHPLNNYELASRLAYFVWSSMPDDELFSLAAQGTLQDDQVLAQQVARLLADPKGIAMSDVFASQWLQLSRLPTHEPKVDVFPGITSELKLAMAQESKLFFQDLLQNAGTIRGLVGANHTYVNGVLAQHYGLAPTSADFAKVTVEGTNRLAGVLGQGGILMLTSGLTKTSAVKRGAWVLDNLLCSPPPAPPPDVAKELVDNQAALEALAETLTQRQFLEGHRAAPKCAVCHALIDPIGLAFENYDAVGRFRDLDKGIAVDPSGVLSDQTPFKDARELVAILGDNPNLAPCVARKLFTFALGRAPGADDAAHVEALTTSNDDSLAAVLTRVVESTPFRSRRGGQGAQ